MFLKLPETLSQRARSSSSHYRDIQNGLFTKPVNLGKRAVGWPLNEVNILNAAQITGLSEAEIKELVVDLHSKRKLALFNVIEANSVAFINGGVESC